MIVDKIKKITGKDVIFYEGDVCDKKLLEEIFNDNKIDAVIHFAGYKAVGESVKKPLMYYRNNIDSTLTLCEVMNEHNVKNIVFSSCLFPFLLFSKSLCYSIQNDGQDDYCDTAFET